MERKNGEFSISIGEFSIFNWRIGEFSIFPLHFGVLQFSDERTLCNEFIAKVAVI